MADTTTRLMLEILGKDVGASRAFERVADAMDHAGREAKDLDGQITHTRTSITNIAKDIHRTGDLTLFKNLNREQSNLRKLLKVKELLPDEKDGEDSGRRVSRGLFGSLTASAGAFGVKLSASIANHIPGALGGALSALGPVAQTAIVGGIVAAIVAGSSFIGAAFTGALVGGLATGAVATGIVLAFQDVRVKAAGKGLAETLMGGLRDAAGVFVQPVLNSIGIIRQGFLDLQPSIAKAFKTAAPFTEVLTRGLVALVRNTLPGLNVALSKAGPLVATIAAGMGAIGAAVGRFFKDIAAQSSGANKGLQDMFTLLAAGIVLTGQLFSQLAATYEKARLLSNILSGNVTGVVADLADKNARAGQSNDTFGGTFDKLRQEIEKATTATLGQVSAVKSLADTLRAQTDPVFAYVTAQRQVKSAQDAVAEAQKQFGTKSPQYRQALEDLAQAQLNLYGASGDLSTTTNKNLLPALEQLRRDGYLSQGSFDALKAAIDRAKAAADKADNTRIRINTAEALAAISRVQQSLGKIKDVHVGVYFTSKGDLKLPGGRQVIGAAGGGLIGGTGTGTSDSNPAMLSKGEYVVREAAVRALGLGFLNQINRAGPGDADKVYRKPALRRPASSRQGAATSTAVGLSVQAGRSGTTAERALTALLLELVATNKLRLKVDVAGRVVAA